MPLLFDQERRLATPPLFMAFDCLYYRGQDLRPRPLATRRNVLEDVLDGLLLAVGAAPWGGGEVGEINRVGLRLRQRMGDDRAWFEEWTQMAETVEAVGRRHGEAKKDASAAAYFFRAAHYYHVGERFLQPKSADDLAAYRRGVECFREATQRVRWPRIETVEVPYEGVSLPALFVHPEGAGGPAPAMIFFDGFDVTKEIQYFKGIPDLAARGIRCLIVDGPGNGEAIRFRQDEPDSTIRRDPPRRRGVFDFGDCRPSQSPKTHSLTGRPS